MCLHVPSVVMQSPSHNDHPMRKTNTHTIRQRVWFTLEVYNYSRLSQVVAQAVRARSCLTH